MRVLVCTQKVALSYIQFILCRQQSGRKMSLQAFLESLHFVSKLFLLSPGNFRKPTGNQRRVFSAVNLCSVVFGLLYLAFHVTNDLDSPSQQASQKMVTNIINTYNRYSGLALYCILIAFVQLQRDKIFRLVNLFNEVEVQFAQQLRIKIRNINVARYNLFCLNSVLILHY